METEFVLSLGEQRWTLPAGADTITLGRASNADIRLQADDQISRIHARLTREGTSWTLHDESRNGTGLNGHRLTTPTALTSGDRIHIGRSVLTFHESTTPDTPAPPTTAPSSAQPAPTLAPLPTAPPTPAPSPQRADATPDLRRDEQPSASLADGLSSAADVRRDQPPGATPAYPPDALSSAADPRRDHSPGTAPAYPPDALSSADPRGDQRPGTAPAYPADALSSSADVRREQPPGTAPAYPADALSSPADVRRDQPSGTAPADALSSPADVGRDQSSAGGTFRSDSADPRGQGQPPAEATPSSASPFAAGFPSTADAQASPSQSPFAPGDRAPAGPSPFAPGDRAADEANPFAPDDRASASPFARDDHGADEANPSAPDNRASAGGNPFASGGRAVEEADSLVSGGRDDGGYGAAGFVPGFEVDGGAERSADAGAWAAYPSADNPEPVRSPWEVSAPIDQSAPNWNESDSWPDPDLATTNRRTPAGQPTDHHATPGHSTTADPHATADRRTAADRHTSTDRRATADRHTAGDRRSQAAERRGDRLPGTATDPDDAEAVGTVRLGRVLVVAGGVIGLGLLVNLIVTFLSDGPGSPLRWLIPPVIALVVAMVLALTDAATTKHDRRGPLDVSVLVAIAVVLVGVGVGGFALTAGAQYVGGYVTGNESGEDRLIKPVAKTGAGITVTVENVTYTGHFTRIEVTVANAAEQPVTIPLDGTTFTAADGTALRADTGKSSWPSAIPAGGSEQGTITFKGHLPDSATAAVLTFKSGDTTFSVPGVTLSR